MRGEQELEFVPSKTGEFGHTRMTLKSVKVDGYLLDSTQVERLWRDGKLKLMEPPEGGLAASHFVPGDQA